MFIQIICRMKHIILSLFLLLPAFVSAQVELTLEMCRSMALENSKQMHIAATQEKKAAFDVRTYRANYFPKLSVSGLGLYNQKKYDYSIKGGYLPTYKPGEDGKLQPNLVIDPETHRPVMGADGNPLFQEYAFLPDIKLRLNLRTVYTAGVQLEQPVYMGGKIRAAYRMAEVGGEIATENVRYNCSEILLETDRAYWQLLRVEEQEQAAESYREVVAQLVKNLEDSQAVGMSTANDVLKARVRYNEAELMLQKARNGRVLASMNLCRLTGLDLYTPIHLPDTLSDRVDRRIWALDTTLALRPDYNMLVHEVTLKEHQVNLTRADYLPQVGVMAGYSYGGGLKLNGDAEAAATFTALAAVKIPVFHWGEGRNKVQAARMEEEASRLNLEKSAELMTLEIASSRFNLRDAQTRVTLAYTALQQALENLKNSSNQFEVGMETLTSLLEAQAQWQQAWSQWIDAKANLHLSESEYLKAIGALRADEKKGCAKSKLLTHPLR